MREKRRIATSPNDCNGPTRYGAIPAGKSDKSVRLMVPFHHESHEQEYDEAATSNSTSEEFRDNYRINEPSTQASQNTGIALSVVLHGNINKKGSPLHEKYTYSEHVFIVGLAMLLAFNSGFSNGVCLSGLLTYNTSTWDRQSTSSCTGVFTSSALSLADHHEDILPQYGTNAQMRYFGFQVCVILSFIGGSCLSALLNPRPIPWRLAPMYAPTFFLGFLFMLAATFVSAYETSGANRFFFFVAAANGIQNGISSMYSANLIRTTHLTGTTTDIGLFVGQWLRGNLNNVWKLQILTGLAISFWCGSFVSFFAVQAWRHYTLLFNAAVFFVIFILIVLFLAINLHLPPWRALRGMWHWHQTLHKIGLRSGKYNTDKPERVGLQHFDSFNTNDKDYITEEELYDGLQMLGLDFINREQAAEMFDLCDTDNDGKILREDFVKAFLGGHLLIG